MNTPVLKENIETLQMYKAHAENFMDYAKQAKSKNSIRAYRFAWKKYQQWCDQWGYNPFQAPNNSIEFLIGIFLSDMAKKRNLKPASLETYLAGLRHCYLEKGIKADTRHDHIRNAMSGIKRELGIKQNQKKALSTEELAKMLEPIQNSLRLIDIRDKALVLVGFAGAFRRSELIAIDFEHIEFSVHGISIHLSRSKTDQEGEGRYVDIPFGKNESLCPVMAIKKWIESVNVQSGPIFRPLDKGGRVFTERLNDKAVATIIKKLAKPFGFESKVAGHSLRSGLVTSALKNGVDTIIIARQTGHRSLNTLKKYERLNREFEQNAAAKVGL